MNWREKASCDGSDWQQFFTEPENHDAINRLQPVAEQHCAGCPVRRECAVFADDHRESGLWAGSFRSTRNGSYQRRPLIDGAPLYELQPRLAGTGVGAWAS